MPRGAWQRGIRWGRLWVGGRRTLASLRNADDPSRSQGRQPGGVMVRSVPLILVGKGCATNLQNEMPERRNAAKGGQLVSTLASPRSGRGDVATRSMATRGALGTALGGWETDACVAAERGRPVAERRPQSGGVMVRSVPLILVGKGCATNLQNEMPERRNAAKGGQLVSTLASPGSGRGDVATRSMPTRGGTALGGWETDACVAAERGRPFVERRGTIGWRDGAARSLNPCGERVRDESTKRNAGSVERGERGTSGVDVGVAAERQRGRCPRGASERGIRWGRHWVGGRRTLASLPNADDPSRSEGRQSGGVMVRSVPLILVGKGCATNLQNEMPDRWNAAKGGQVVSTLASPRSGRGRCHAEHGNEGCAGGWGGGPPRRCGGSTRGRSDVEHRNELGANG